MAPPIPSPVASPDQVKQGNAPKKGESSGATEDGLLKSIDSKLLAMDKEAYKATKQTSTKSGFATAMNDCMKNMRELGEFFAGKNSAIKDALSFLSADGMGGMINSFISDLMVDDGKDGDFGLGGPWTDYLCNTIGMWLGKVGELIELAIELVMGFLKLVMKIVSLAIDMLTKLVGLLSGCLTSIVNMLGDLFSTDWFSSGNWEMKGLIELMANCYCLTSAVAFLFSCDEVLTPMDKRTNATNRRDAEAVIACIKARCPEIDLTSLNNCLMGMIKSIVGIVVSFLLGLVNTILNAFKNMIIQGIRKIIQQISKVLLARFDTFIPGKIDGAWSCLFTFSAKSDEYGDPRTVRGNGPLSYTSYNMSVLDIVETLKGWSNCLGAICVAFGRKCEYKYGDYKKSLKLNSPVWNNSLSSDIMSQCMDLPEYDPSASFETVGAAFDNCVGQTRRLKNEAKKFGGEMVDLWGTITGLFGYGDSGPSIKEIIMQCIGLKTSHKTKFFVDCNDENLLARLEAAKQDCIAKGLDPAGVTIETVELSGVTYCYVAGECGVETPTGSNQASNQNGYLYLTSQVEQDIMNIETDLLVVATETTGLAYG